MKTSENIGAISLALSQAQAELTNVFKAKSGYQFHYADLGQVLDTIRQALPKHELAIIQTASNDGTNVAVTTMLSHSSGEWIKDTISIAVEVAKGNSFAQSVGSTITYLRRYQASAICGITQSDDDMSIKNDADPEGTQSHPAEMIRLASKVELLTVKNKAEEAGVDVNTILEKLKLKDLSEMTSQQAERTMRKLHASLASSELASPTVKDVPQEKAS